MSTYRTIFNVAILLVCLATTLAAQEFRIQSQVFLEGVSAPVSENLTIYSPHYTYDFTMRDNAPTEIVVFDSRNRSFVLIDVQRKVRTEIPDFELIQMIEGLRNSADVNEDSKFLLQPEFPAAEVDLRKGTIAISNDDMSYKVTCVSVDDTAAMSTFYRSLDQLTRLGASDPRRLPPFPRMALNREIRQSGMFPTDVHLSMRAGVMGSDPFEARSRHTPAWELTDSDRELIQTAKSHWIQFPKISLVAYRGIEVAKDESDK